MTTFNFSRGHPNKDLVPLQEIRQLMAQLGSSEISHDEEEAIQKSLNYGDDAGNDSTLQQLAYFLERQCTNDQHVVAEGQARCDMNGLFITGGVSHGIDLLCAIATQPGDVIWVEEPSYFLSFGIFRSHRLQIETFPMYSPGVIDIDALEEELNSGSRPVPRVMYIIPTHQNPTGQTMPQKQRKRLANIVNRFKILLIADEVYHLLDYNRKLSAQKRPARMALFNEAVFDDIGDHTDNTLVGCCSVSGFTKIFGPGVRLGWIEGPQSIINALRRHGYIISQGGVAPFLGNVFCIALQQRVCDNVLNRLCHAYAHRVELLMGILKEETRWMIPCRPSGGFFLWLVLPFEARAFLEYCRPQVSFILGTDCSARSGNKNVFMQDELARSLRLCFAYLALEDLLAGARLLQSKFKQFLNDAQPAAGLFIKMVDSILQKLEQPLLEAGAGLDHEKISISSKAKKTLRVDCSLDDDKTAIISICAWFYYMVMWTILPVLLWVDFSMALYRRDDDDQSPELGIKTGMVQFSIILFIIASHLFRQTIHEIGIKHTYIALLPEIMRDCVLLLILCEQLIWAFSFLLWPVCYGLQRTCDVHSNRRRKRL